MLGMSSSIANVGDRRKEGGISPHVIYIYSICYVIVRLRRLTIQVHCSIHVVVNSSGQNFGLTDVMRSRIGYVLIATSFCYCYCAARTEGTIYWC